MRRARLAINRFGASLIFRLYPHRQLHGMRIVFTDLELDRDIGVARLEQALVLLATTDAPRYRQIVRYVRHIIIWAGNYTAANAPGNIQLCSAHLMESSQIELASVFVHEAVHLRIARYGIPYHEALRERIERRCIREQAAFLRKQGAEGEAMADIFERALETPWWTDEAHREDIERLVTDAGLPRWMIPQMKTRG